MERVDLIVCGVDFPQIWKLFDPFQVLQLVVRDIN